jgi:hypothetical protein
MDMQHSEDGAFYPRCEPWKDPPFLIGKPSINGHKWAISHGYVK